MKKLKVMRSWKTLTLLLIVVPMGLLATFRLIGILSEPQGPITIAETITLETVKWELERPYGAIDIFENIEAPYTGYDLSIIHSIFVDDYLDEFWGHGGDYIALRVNVTATLQTGFVNSVNVTFREDYENSEVGFFEVQAWPQFYSHVENLSIANYAHHLRGIGLKAFMALEGKNSPRNVHFDGSVYWILRSPQNRTHLLEIATELVYHNGTTYKKVVQPFQLKIGPDNNDSFETAQEIHEGYYPKLYIGTVGDKKDYYKIYATQGQRIKVIVNATGRGPSSPFFSLYLYDPERNLVVANELGDYVQTIDFVTNSNGFWFIEIRINASHGFYSIGANK